MRSHSLLLCGRSPCLETNHLLIPNLVRKVSVKSLIVAAAAFEQQQQRTLLRRIRQSGVRVGGGEIVERDLDDRSEFLRLFTTTTLVQVASTLQPFALPRLVSLLFLR